MFLLIYVTMFSMCHYLQRSYQGNHFISFWFKNALFILFNYFSDSEFFLLSKWNKLCQKYLLKNLFLMRCMWKIDRVRDSKFLAHVNIDDEMHGNAVTLTFRNIAARLHVRCDSWGHYITFINIYWVIVRCF